MEQLLGHGDNATTEQDISNPANDRARYGDPNINMKALCWMGKNKVEVGTYTSCPVCCACTDTS